MIMYQSMTTTRRNRAAIVGAGWRWFVAPGSPTRRVDDTRYALDNGAWSAYQSGQPWEAGPFVRLVDEMGTEADFIVAPDIVAGGMESLALSLSWLDRLPGLRLIAVQDGMEPPDLAPHVGPKVGIFLGGSTEWKIARMRDWGRFCRDRCYYHVGRVNTLRRIRLAFDAGADSVDGSSCSRFSINVPFLDQEIRQERLWKNIL